MEMVTPSTECGFFSSRPTAIRLNNELEFFNILDTETMIPMKTTSDAIQEQNQRPVP